MISLLEIIFGNGTENFREMPSATPRPQRENKRNPPGNCSYFTKPSL